MSWEEKAGVVENKGKNYTWSQSISDVSIILPIPEGTTGKQVDWSIKATSIKFGIRGQTPLLEGELYGAIKPDESAWTVEEKKQLVIQLEKAKKHESWASVIKGQDEVDPATKESMDKKMLLEKFQRDYPGFDFSGAELTGQMPADPATYLHPSTFEK